MTEITASELLDTLAEFGLLFDVRSPFEHAESHVPEAQNLYALSDAEREKVGALRIRIVVKIADFGKSIKQIMKYQHFHSIQTQDMLLSCVSNSRML